MYAEREISSIPYRAPLNPAFVRRVMERRRMEAAALAREAASAEREAKRLAALRQAEERKEAREAARRMQAEAAKTIAAAQADLGQAMVYRVESGRQRTYAEIEAKALRLFKMTKSELHSNRRHLDVVLARQFVCYWSVRLTRLSSVQIGRLMSGRDHTTILWGKLSYVRKRAEMGRYLRPVR